jgi:ABC-2 type transport system permease protein
MNKSLIVAKRELKERIFSRSFLLMAMSGPILVLSFTYLLFALGGKNKANWKVLIVDPISIMEGKIMAKEDASITYFFANDYIEIEDFKSGKKYQDFDALLEVNEKILSNKSAFLFYREKPSNKIAARVQYQFERRLEEIMVQRFTDLSLTKFRQLKQPINLSFRNVYDPKDEASNLNAWVGFVFGVGIVLFIFMFGMTILRSTMKEKSNRIVEVLLASLNPKQLMLGKIIGIGFAALIQFSFWVIIIGLGLYFMRETLFPDLLDASKMNFAHMSDEVKNQSMQEMMFSAREYNQFVELVYESINFENMLFYFVLFFVVAYFFYASFFATLGALSGSESDAQQFVIPLLFILFFAIYAGHFCINNPNHSFSSLYSYLPFTAPVVCMVKLAQGYAEGQSYQLFVSLFILLISAFFMLWISGRLYQNGILQFGHRLRFKHIIKWIKRA